MDKEIIEGLAEVCNMLAELDCCTEKQKKELKN